MAELGWQVGWGGHQGTSFKFQMGKPRSELAEQGCGREGEGTLLVVEVRREHSKQDDECQEGKIDRFVKEVN
jgi:hypothetical protein